MSKVLKSFLKNEDGAALLEYTVLLGILLVTVIASISSVGSWIDTKWSKMVTDLGKP
ncbi:Flp family type IVb pilin [uncultured Alsobacter sp.]|uniref:Flp family type IVb pilin n=1 Tax=uncultured Alsobacter sp. TaxID=1748258 RepID=UPI0025CEF98D|nr:Flp family type IVb pilin [uncultured Alsobacter sp.]